MNLANLRRYATRGVVASAVALGVVLTLATAIAIYRFFPAQTVESPGEGLTWIQGPTNTPVPATPTLFPTSTATATFEPLASGEMGIGSYVQIVGTEGTGLNIRNAPGLTATIQFLGYDSEVFEIRDGPREADGFTWWFLVTPVDDSRAGWAAANYLALVANP